MILYVLLAAFVVGLLGGAGGMNWWNDATNARHELAAKEAQAEVDQLAHEAVVAASNNIIDMTAAYQAGESKAKIVYRDRVAKGQQNVAAYEVFRNPLCVLPPVILSDLNYQRTGIQSAAPAAGSAGPLHGAGGATGRVDGEPVPATGQGLGAVGGVPQTTGSTGVAGEVPRASSGGIRPKPKPTN